MHASLWLEARQLAESRERAGWHEHMSRGKVDLPEQLQVASEAKQHSTCMIARPELCCTLRIRVGHHSQGSMCVWEHVRRGRSDSLSSFR